MSEYTDDNTVGIVGFTERNPEAASRCEISEQTDAQLMDRVALRDQLAVGELYRRYSGSMFSLAHRIVRDRQLAEDVCQEVFLGLWDNKVCFDPQRGKLRSLLITRTHGKSVDLIRSRNAQLVRDSRFLEDRSISETTTSSDHHRDICDRADCQQVRAAVDGLSVSLRTVLEFAYYGGHSCRQVAVLLGLPEGTVKTRMRSALRQLRVVLDEQFAAEFGGKQPERQSPVRHDLGDG